MTKAEVIANAIADPKSTEEEIALLNEAPEDQFESQEEEEEVVVEGKESGNVEVDANALPQENAPKDLELNLEDTSSDLPVEKAKEDPIEAFFVKPSFFGKVGKDGGITDSPNEDFAAKELNKKLSGLGIKIDKDTDGLNIINVVMPGGEQEKIALGIFKNYLTVDDQTPQEKADTLNNLIMDVVELKKSENPNFSLETYANAYDKAVNDTPEFYAASKDGGRFLELDELSYDQLQSHAQKVNLNLMNDYFESEEGIKNAKVITQTKQEVNKVLTSEAFKEMVGKSYEEQLAIAIKYTKAIDQAHVKIYEKNVSFQTMLSNSANVMDSLYKDKLLNLHAQENREDQFGGFIASSDILTAFAKGATVVFPKEIQEFSAMQRQPKIKKLKEQLAALNGVDGDEIVNALGYYESNALDKNIKGGKYKASELKVKLLDAIAHNEMMMIGNLLKAKEYEGVLDLLSKPNEEMFKDGKLNITADNWQMAIGDQGFRMMSSIFSGGMTTMVSEAGGAYSQILEGLGRKEYGENHETPWSTMTAQKKAEAFMRYVDSDEVDWEKAMAVGGVNTVLENLSNVFFVSKIAKPVTSNLIGYFKLFMKGKIKQGLIQIGKGVGAKELMPILSTTLVETITEGLQEEVTQYGVGTALQDYSHSWNSTLNSMITAAVTTPFIGGGAKTTNMVYNEVSAKLVAMRSKDEMVKYAQKQKEMWVQQVADGTMTQADYDKNMLYIDAIPNMFTETDKKVTDPESMVMIFEAQLAIEEQKKKYNELEKKKEASKDLFPLKKEEINEAENEAELESIMEELEKAELEKRKGKRLDAYRSGNYESVSEINTDAIYSKDFEGKLFETNEEVLNYLEEQYGIKRDNPAIAKFVNGEANGITLTPRDMKEILGTPYNGKGVFFISDKAVVDGIMNGDKYSANAIKHEIDHVRMYYQTDKVLKEAQDNIIDKLKKSKSPQMQEVSRLLAQRIRDYEKAYGKKWDPNSRLALEEFFTAIGDVTSVLSSNVSTLEDRKTILNIGKEFASLLNLEGAKNSWDVEKTLEFLQTFPNTKKVKPRVYVDDNDNVITSIDEDVDTKFSLKDGRQSDLILIEDSNPYGKTQRDNVEIYEENKRLNKLIEKNETFVHPDGDMEMQERVRKEGGKKYRDQLLFNNFAQFKTLLKAYKEDHALHTDERKEFFVGQAMEQFVKALGTYNKDKQGNYQMKNDSFSAYYFGDPKTDVAGKTKDGRSIAKLRLVQIWEDMKAEFTIQIEDMTGEESQSDYDQDYIIDIQDKLKDYNERSALREGLAQVMDFEVDGPMYNAFVSDVSESLAGFDFETIFDPNAPQEMRKKGMNLWKGFKKFMELDLSKNPKVKDNKIFKNYLPTEFYQELITENIETYYNQLDQKTFNDIFIDHTEVVIDEDTNPETGRLTVTGSKKAKGIKDKKAGNVKRKKKKFTPEIEAIILEQLLKTNQIAQLKAEGKTNAEIHKIIRMDMVQQSTLKNFTDILFKDAAMQVVTSEAFKSENGIGASETSQMALLMDKGIDAKFQLVDGSIGVIDASIGSVYFVQQVNRITRSVDGYTDSNNYEEVIDYILADKIAPKEIKDWVAAMYNKGEVEAAGERKFKGYTVNNENIPAEIRKAFNDGGNIKFNTDARSEMVKNAAVMTKIFGKEFMDAVGFSFLGFQGGSRYLDNSARKQRPGWKKGEPNRWIEGAVGGELDGYNSIVEGLKSVAEENLPGGLTYEDLANVRIMNIGADGKEGVMKRLTVILDDKTMTDAQKSELIESSGLGAEIDAANIANEKVMKAIISTLAEEVRDGNLDEVGVLEMFKMQSNLVFGLRGLSRLDGWLMPNGKIDPKWKGEHAKSMSQVSSDIVDLIYRNKNNPKGTNLDAEIDLILAEYTQILGDNAVFDILDEPGKTNVAGINRLAYLSDGQLKGITNNSKETPRQIQARLLIKRQIKENVIKSQKKAEAVENINLKNTSTGTIQGATVMDFDETVGVSENYILATKDGKTVKISSADWPNVGDGMVKDGWSMDFTDFNKVTDGKPGPLFDKLKNQIAKYGVDNVHILTARAKESAPAIQAWLASQGINLPIENITGLGNSTGEAKADWIEQNFILNGFNDIYFVDDAHTNVDAVAKMFATYPEGLLVDGGKSVLVNPVEVDPNGAKYSLNDTFNEILETSTKIRKEAKYSPAIGKIEGDKHSSIADIIYPPSAYDFEMFTYRYISDGQLGENQKLFFKEKLQDPYERASNEINKEKQAIRNGYKEILKELPDVKKNLKENVEGTKFNYDQAVRVYLWNKNGIQIPGISKRDEKALVAAVKNSEELTIFADKLSALSKQKEGYILPSEYWTVEGIAHDLGEITGKAGRAKHLVEWKDNMLQIFSEENKAKLRAAYGNDHVEALENMLYRMEYGTSPGTTGRIEQQWNNWVNNSVGAVMFFNMRSAALQTISAVNYIDWENNNIAKAGLAFANQPQYWKDFSMIFNSDYLKERRQGNQRTVNEAELTSAIRGSKNKAKAALAYLLEKGFAPTQIADSFAISSGGAAFYRNTVKAYKKSGMTTEEAEAQAFVDFQAKTELGQQSSRPDLISQQQAGGLGRLILAFKNTPMQYNRLMIKAVLDVKNRRGNLKSNLSKIAYYGAVQNVIFNSLQTALFSALGDEDEWDKKTDRIANGMIDSILNGMGLTGAVAVTIKNGYLEYSRQKERGFRGDHTRTLIAFANLSPTIGSKLRKLYGGIKTEQLNQGAIEEMGFTTENPAFSALANVISATTNIPADRVIGKINNIILASSSETEAMDRIALLMGYNSWDLNIETKARKVNEEVKARKKEEKKAFDFQKKNNYNKTEEQKNIVKQKQEKKEGKKVTCSYNTSKGRCGVVVQGGGTRCTIHEEVEQRKDGKKPQCTHVKKDGKRCGVMTANKSGLCYYHD